MVNAGPNTDLKEATMSKLRILALVVGVVVALTVPVVTASAKQPQRKSAACASPKNQKINISWAEGSVTTTVYFNNHCAQKRAIALDFVFSNHTEKTECITVNPRTKGRKKIQYGLPNAVSLPARCPT
jgi:hypothetical protein